MTETKDQLWKAQPGEPEPLEELVKTGGHPIGLDVGTSKVVSARRGGKDVACAIQLNAFIPVPYSPVTERTIQQQSEIHHFRDGGEIVIFGSATERFANMFNAETRRTMADGLINPGEKLAWPVLEQILQERRGLILVTGTTGSGKSTTLAALMDFVNMTRTEHILTIEDPIEFLHRDKKSLVNQGINIQL